MAVGSRLPSRFPVGTKFVIEARPRGRSQVYTRHLEFPDGKVLRLPEQPAPRKSGRRCKPRAR